MGGQAIFVFHNTSFIYFRVLSAALAYGFALVYCMLLYSSVAPARASKGIVDLFLEDAVVVLSPLLLDAVDFPSARSGSLLCRPVVLERWR